MHVEAKIANPQVKGGAIPYLLVDGAIKVADFYRKAFAAEDVALIPPDEKGRTMHIHLYINDGSVMLCDPYPEYGNAYQPPAGYTLHLQVQDIDAWWKRAVDAGCTVVMPIDLMFWGDRYGLLRDPFGVQWSMGETPAA